MHSAALPLLAIPILGLLLGLSNQAAAQSSVQISEFNSQTLEHWTTREFSGQTQYQIIKLDGNFVLSASSRQSASGLVKKIDVDLFETPYLNWSWRVEQALEQLAEQTKSGDDFVARIYLICEDRWFKWNTIALNYVWSSRPKQLSPWGNPFVPDNAKMIALRDSSSPNQTWTFEKRDVYQDLILAFGDKGSPLANEKAYRYINAVAIMTDTDNSQGQASALYGDISFSTD